MAAVLLPNHSVVSLLMSSTYVSCLSALRSVWLPYVFCNFCLGFAIRTAHFIQIYLKVIIYKTKSIPLYTNAYLKLNIHEHNCFQASGSKTVPSDQQHATEEKKYITIQHEKCSNSLGVMFNVCVPQCEM